jgi:DNA-binding transcriptional LysR family regulator
MLNLENIQAFLRVAERGSFTAAAAQLDLPLTSVSRRVKALEDEIGVQLLYRTTRRVSVTEAGREYYERCVRAEELLDEADRSIRAVLTEPEGTLRVLTPYAPGLIVLEPALIEFRRRFPKVQLLISYDNKPLDPIEHGFDVALRMGPLPDSGYSARPLGQSRVKLAASPAYLERAGRPTTPQDLLKHDLLSLGDTPLVKWQLKNKSGAIVDVVAKPILISNESATIIRQVTSGAGIGLISNQLMLPRLAQGVLEIVLPDWSRASDVRISAVFPKRATLDRKVRAFVDFVAEVFAPWKLSSEQPSDDSFG